MKKKIFTLLLATHLSSYTEEYKVVNTAFATGITMSVLATAIDYYQNNMPTRNPTDNSRFNACLRYIIDPAKYPHLFNGTHRLIATVTHNFCTVGIPSALISEGLAHVYNKQYINTTKQELKATISAHLPNTQTLHNAEQKYGPHLATVAKNFFSLCIGTAKHIAAGGKEAITEAIKK